MDIAGTSMIHARAPHFLWPYAVRYAAHQLNLQPRVSQPEASPTSLWTGSPSVGSAFRVWGCLALVRDTSADKLLARAVPYIFLGFPVLQRFGFQVSATQPTPLAVDHRLTGPFPNEPFEPSAPYPELVGCLMYLMTFTCPDLAYPLSVLSCFVGPGRHRLVHWTAVVRVATYLVTTSGMGLLLGGNRPVELTGHCDSSYADDVETQRSTQGYCFSLRAGAVSWRSTRSSSVASSSAKAEIYAGAMASQELR
ncbi:unnamed protein product [Closterium sp. NIES-54]